MTEVCSISSIQALCNDSCNHGDIDEVACNEVLDYSCNGCRGRCKASSPVVGCVGQNIFNHTGPLCKCTGISCKFACDAGSLTSLQELPFPGVTRIIQLGP